MALNFAEKVPFNILTNIIKVIIISLIGLWITPYYINSLGKSAYGLVTLANTVTAYMTIVVGALGGACSRYTIVAIRHNDDTSKVISTCFYGILRLCLYALPVIFFVSIGAPFIFNIGNTPGVDIQIMFFLVLFSAIIGCMCSIPRSIFESRNSIYYGNIVDICCTTIQAVSAVMLFVLNKPSVTLIGLSFLISSVLSFTLLYLISKKEYSNYKIRRSNYDRELYKEIGELAKWNVVSSIGSVLFINASTIIVNILLGDDTGGYFAIIVSLTTMITTACYTLTHAFGPFTLLYYAERNIEMMTKVLSSGIKFVSLVIAMPLAYVMVFSPQILTAWVGPDFSILGKYIAIVAISFLIYCSVFSLYSVPGAFIAVRESSMITIIFGIMNIIMAVLFCTLTDWGIKGVVVAYSISILFFSIFYMNLCEKLMSLKRYHFAKLIMPGAILFAASFAILFIINEANVIIGTWPSVIISFIVMFAVYMLIVIMVLNKEDKNLIEGILTGKFKTMFHKVFNRQ